MPEADLPVVGIVRRRHLQEAGRERRLGVVDRLGIGYEAVAKRNPGIIFCSLSAFGQTGEMSTRPSHDLGAQAITGVLSLGSRGADDTALPPTAPLLLP